MLRSSILLRPSIRILANANGLNADGSPKSKYRHRLMSSEIKHDLTLPQSWKSKQMTPSSEEQGYRINPENLMVIRDMDAELVDWGKYSSNNEEIMEDEGQENLEEEDEIGQDDAKSETTTAKFTSNKIVDPWKLEYKNYSDNLVFGGFNLRGINMSWWNESTKSTAKQIGLAILLGAWDILTALVNVIIPRRFRYKGVKKHVILITGAGSGIGQLMAKVLALEHGAIIVCWDINEKGNKTTVDEITRFGGKCFAYNVDLSSRESIYENAKRVQAEVGKVQILINNAGFVAGKKLLNTVDDDVVKMFQVHALANFWTTKAFLPDMIANGRGHIVTIASIAGMFGLKQLVDYCSSKYAAVGFHEALKNELSCDEDTKCIKTTLVCTYYIHTGLFDGVNSKLIPVLRPQPTVDDIVAGILSNQETIIIPRYLYLLVLFKSIVPGPVSRRFAEAFGVSSTMSTFIGRNNRPAKQNDTPAAKQENPK